MRESPSLKLMEILKARGAKVSFHDPFVPVIPRTREHPQFAGLASVRLTAEEVDCADAVLIATDHDGVDYALIAEHAQLVIDTRNAMERQGVANERVVKA
jgi:UDP-N-acetyl-D-glucosamine dehydrogenase